MTDVLLALAAVVLLCGAWIADSKVPKHDEAAAKHWTDDPC